MGLTMIIILLLQRWQKALKNNLLGYEKILKKYLFLEEFVELNANSNTMIKNVRHVELNISIVTVFLNTKNLTIIEYQCLCNENYQHNSMKS